MEDREGEQLEPKQSTQPKGKDSRGKPAKPVEIPVPKREVFDRLVRKAAKSGQEPPPRPRTSGR